MKKKISILILISIGFLFYYFNQYHIDNNGEAIQTNLKHWLNRGSSLETLEPDVLTLVQLQDTASYVILFKVEEGNYGYAHLIKGLNGKFKIVSSGHGGSLSYRIIETNKENYMVLYGENPKLQINHILAKSIHGDFSMEANVSNEETFVKYAKIPKHLQNLFPAELTFFNENNEEIKIASYPN